MFTTKTAEKIILDVLTDWEDKGEGYGLGLISVWDNCPVADPEVYDPREWATLMRAVDRLASQGKISRHRFGTPGNLDRSACGEYLRLA